MSLQRQHFLLSYLKTLSVGQAKVRTHDLPHGSPMLNQLSQLVGGQYCVPTGSEISRFLPVKPQKGKILFSTFRQELHEDLMKQIK